MALWEVRYPVNYTSGGDQTRHAMGKHIKEISKIYEHLNMLRRLSDGDTPPLNPETYDIWCNHITNELLVYIEGSGWISILQVKKAEESVNSEMLGGFTAADFVKSGDLQDITTQINNSAAAAAASVNDLRDYVDTRILGLLSSSSFVFMGTWQDGGGYVPYNVVEYLGSSYILKSGNGLEPPGNSTEWQLVAAAGAGDYITSIDGGRAATVLFGGTIGGGGAAV